MYAFFTVKSCSRCSTPRAWKAECMHFLRWNRARVAQRPELGKQNVCIFTVKSCWRCFLGPFCGLGLEILQNCFLGASWAHSAAWAWKCSKMVFWELPKRILRPGLGNAPKLCSGSFLGSFCGLGLEMLQNDVCSKTPVPTVYVFMRWFPPLTLPGSWITHVFELSGAIFVPGAKRKITPFLNCGVQQFKSPPVCVGRCLWRLGSMALWNVFGCVCWRVCVCARVFVFVCNTMSLCLEATCVVFTDKF